MKCGILFKKVWFGRGKSERINNKDLYFNEHRIYFSATSHFENVFYLTGKPVWTLRTEEVKVMKKIPSSKGIFC